MTKWNDIVLLGELGVQSISPMEVFCDNLFAISIAKNLVHHDHTKHIELDHHLWGRNTQIGVYSYKFWSG